MNLDKDKVAEKVQEVGQQKAADHFGVSRSTLRDFCYKHSLPTTKLKPPTITESDPTVKIKKDTAEVTSPITSELSDHEKLVRDRGFDTKEWEFSGATVNEWDGPDGSVNRQLKVNLKRKYSSEKVIEPARTDGPTFKKPKKRKISKGGELFVFLGDQQAPYHDKTLHEKMCLFLEEQNPHTIVNIGDSMDLPDISKYKANPEHHVSPQKCVDAAYSIFRDQRTACPDSRIVKLIGNHDVRLRDFILEWAPEFYGLTRADNGEPQSPVLSAEFLLRLDELKIELIGDGNRYEHGQFTASKYLAARHGWIARKGSGASALSTLEHLGYSIIVGHTHRLSLVYKTMHDIDGEGKKILAAGESGCMCTVDSEGHGFAPNPDWQQGAITAQIYPDGFFKLDTINYVDENLLWRDNRY